MLGATLEGTINIEETKLNNAEDSTFLAASKKWLDHIKGSVATTYTSIRALGSWQ